MSSVPNELASVAQTAHVRNNPDPRFDVTPSTASEITEAVTIDGSRQGYATGEIDVDEDLEDYGDDDEDIPYSALRPLPRRRHLPPLPDLRFEQSYLHSISNVDTWWKVLLITARDQVFMPLVQGLIYNLLLCGWQHWNRNARSHGNSVGARLRRWWYGVNNWPLSKQKNKLG